MDPTEIIISRVLKAIQEGQTIGLGNGIPQLIRPHLGASIQVVELPQDPESPSIDLMIVEALDISQQGDLVLTSDPDLENLQPHQWIVATLHLRENGEAKIVQTCHLPVSHSSCAPTIVTELGVMKITDVGLVLEEVAPGISTDDVKSQTGASIHVADDIKVMEL